MARKKGRHKARAVKKNKAKKSKARSKSGFGRSVSQGYSIDTLPRILLSAAILRFGSGVVYWWFRKQFQTPGADPKKTQDNFNKAKIIFPLVIAIASAKKWIPQMPGLTPMAIGMAFFSIVENFDMFRDLFDLKALDAKQSGTSSKTPATMVAGASAREWAETRRQLENMHVPRSGIFATNMPRRFSGINVERSPRGFSGRDPRFEKRISN